MADTTTPAPAASAPNPGVSTPTPPTSRGRALLVRVASAAVLIAIVVATLAWWHWGLVLLVAALLAVAVWELRNAAARKGIADSWQILIVAAPLIVIVAYALSTVEPLTSRLGHPDPAGVSILLLAAAVMAVLGWRLRRGVTGYLADVAVSVFTLGYLVVPGLAVVWLVASNRPVALLVAYVACIAANDSGAYLLGSMLGRHKMIPGVSPAKTWEGFAGGVLLAAVAGVLLGLFLLHVSWWWGLVFGVVLAAGATIGDLVESALKRDVGVKDMGRLMPGHGGALDRLDSLLYCAPLAVILYSLMGLLPGGLRMP